MQAGEVGSANRARQVQPQHLGAHRGRQCAHLEVLGGYTTRHFIRFDKNSRHIYPDPPDQSGCVQQDCDCREITPAMERMKSPKLRTKTTKNRSQPVRPVPMAEPQCIPRLALAQADDLEEFTHLVFMDQFKRQRPLCLRMSLHIR